MGSLSRPRDMEYLAPTWVEHHILGGCLGLNGDLCIIWRTNCMVDRSIVGKQSYLAASVYFEACHLCTSDVP